MSEPFPKGDFVRIIYERGVQLLRAAEGWLVPSSLKLERVAAPGDFEATYDLQHIICDTEFNVPFFQPRRMFDPQGKPVSRSRYLKGYVEEGQRRIYKYMVEHHLYCAVAHLGYLAEAYAGLAVLYNENRWTLPEHVREYSKTQLEDSALRHAEAVLTSLGSAMDASRFLVWRDNFRPPANLTDTLELLMTTGERDLRMILSPYEDLWANVGPILLAYRDSCVTHHPITRLGGRCGAFLNDGDIWEIRMDLPDKPGARHAEDFTFFDQVDLLDYCWRTTCTIVRCVEVTLPQVYELAILGQEPSRWYWLTDA
jgi:hypothetical protein